tara:strand:- start:113 stop:313 length:201 start_codon:yes stop_codon:yes gene_type:complete
MRNRLTTTATISTTNQEMFMASLDFNIENWHLVTDDQELPVTDINQRLDDLLMDRSSSFSMDDDIS